MENLREDMKFFIQHGWSLKQFEMQLLKKNNLGIGIFQKKALKAFILGDLIDIEKKIEYEILIIYVNISERKLGYATTLINSIPITIKDKTLKKIYLEVASNNFPAIDLYKKNEFIKIGIRKKYYTMDCKKIDAIFFEKIINE